jgi:hypothetical protein
MPYRRCRHHYRNRHRFRPIPCGDPPAAPPPALVQVESPPIRLAAQVQPTVAATSLPGLLVDWLQRIAVPPSAGQPFPTPQFPPVVAPTSIGSSIKSVYNAVEPWVRWDFDVATTEATQANERHSAVRDKELTAAPDERAAAPDDEAAAPDQEAAVSAERSP